MYLTETKSGSSYQEYHKEDIGQVARLAEKGDQNLKGAFFVLVTDVKNFIKKRKKKEEILLINIKKLQNIFTIKNYTLFYFTLF